MITKQQIQKQVWDILLLTEKWLLILMLEVSPKSTPKRKRKKMKMSGRVVRPKKKRVSLLKEKTVSSKLEDPRSDLLEEEKDEEGRLGRLKK